MHIFTQTLLAVYKEFPRASTEKICHHLGVPPQMVRESREYLHRRGYLDKDENLSYHITRKGEEELARIDRQLARQEIEFIAGATETACKALGTTKEHLHSFALMAMRGRLSLRRIYRGIFTKRQIGYRFLRISSVEPNPIIFPWVIFICNVTYNL